MEHDDELGHLRRQLQTLRDQVKLLVKTERRLNKSEKDLQRQLRCINELSEFTLDAARTLDLGEIQGLTLKTLFGLFALDQAVGFLCDAAGDMVPAVVHAASGLEGQSIERLAKADWRQPITQGQLPQEPLVLKASEIGSQLPEMQPYWDCMQRLFEGALEDEDTVDFRDTIVLVLPLRRKGDEILGLLLVRKLDPRALSYHEELPKKADVPFLQVVCTHLESALDNALLQAERQRAREEQQRLARELEIATQIQQSLLPTKPPAIPGIDIAFHFKPADEVGGDYYDLLLIGDDLLAVAVGDVNGHGLGAALLMAMAKSSLHTQASRDPNVTSVMTGLNDMIYGATTERRFMTFIYAVIDLKTHRMVSSNAGHPFPYRLCGESGKVSALEVPPVYPLGVRRKGKYNLYDSQMVDGDVLVFYSDGIIEGRNPAGEEFGFDRFEAVIQAHPAISAAGVRDALLQAFADFGGVQDDDMTLVVLKFNAAPVAEPVLDEASA